MCDEHADLWRQKWRTARKEHTCCECGYKIQPRTKYLHVKMLFDGAWSNYDVCIICNAHWEIFKGAFDGCIILEGLQEAEHETQYDVEDQFILIDSNAAEFMKEQYFEDNSQFGVGA